MVVMQSVLQFTTSGTSLDSNSLQSHSIRQSAKRTASKTSTAAYNPYATQYGQQSWNPRQESQPANWGFGAGAFVGLVITLLLALTSNAYVTGIFFLVTLLLTAATHYTAR